jgi:hypothetical protein
MAMLHSLRVSSVIAATLCYLLAYAQAPLTPAQVRSVIDTLKELKQEFDRNDAYDFERMAQLESLVKTREAYDRYVGIIAKHGFTDPAKWAETVTRVFYAYGTYKMKTQRPKMDAQMRQSMAAIENDPNLTSEQKQQMMQMMNQAGQSMNAYMNAPAADVEAVKPLVGEIDATFAR